LSTLMVKIAFLKNVECKNVFLRGGNLLRGDDELT